MPLGILAILIVGVGAGIAGKRILDQAYEARDALAQAIPLAKTAQKQILNSDSAGAEQTVARLSALTAEARVSTSGSLWRSAEAIPFVGPNLTAVRTVSAVVDDLATEAVTPLSTLSLDRLTPSDGRIDTGAISEASTIVDRAGTAIDAASATIAGIDTSGLIDQVSEGVTQLDDVLGGIRPLLGPARSTLALLPGLLGVDAPRNYLVLVQNNAESRGTGGNPAALVMIHVDNGALSISQQASSSDFANGRAASIIPLYPETVALYSDKLGRNMQDVTITPQFTESADIMGAFWAESFGTRIDGTLSIDPVALSYLMAATGPVTLPNGDVLTSENVVDELLNRVYFRFDAPADQDAYFATAAGAVFSALTSTRDPRALVEQVVRAVDEGRIMYVPKDPAEVQAVAGSRLAGTLPSGNTPATMVGSYINDITEGKLDYYLNTALAVASDMCTVDASSAPQFTVTTTLTSTLQPSDVEDLAWYISPGHYFPKGDISTDVVVYGPVGASVAAAAVDGAAVSVSPVTHLGRPAVKINVMNHPATTHQVTVTFTGVVGEDYGPIEAWHTPMVRETPVMIDSPGCTPQG